MTSKLRPISVPVPRLKRNVGLGEVVKKVTTVFGIKPCAGCGRRAETLDRVVVFRGTERPK